MCASPARHRAARNGSSGSQRDFWSAKDLVEGVADGGPARHARKTPSKISIHVGRVGALAVSLGVGLAVANSSGVAYADSDTESSVSSSGADATPAGSSTPGGADESPEAQTGPDSGGDADDNEDGEDAEAGDTDEPGDVLDPDSDPESGADDEQAAEESGDNSAAPGDSGETSGTAPVVEPSVPPRESDALEEADESAVDADLDVEVSTPDGAHEDAAIPATEAVSLSGGSAVAPASPAEEESLESVSLFAAVVSNVVAPLADPEAPAPAPWLDALLAWVRRQINHTFFNKTPVYGPISTEQILTGQLLIDLHASDPNGDPLTYDIIQPEHGWVFRDLITGRFVYTPDELVAGDPLVDSFQVVIRDDSEHLSGTLGSIQKLLHGVARLFGLAQADNVTVTVPVFVDPVIQLPPLITPIAGPGYTLGGDPVKLVSSVLVADGDSDELSQVVIKIATLGQDGDLLEYVAPQGNPITATWDAQTMTLTLSGVATTAQYQQAIEAVTFSATDGALLVRGVTLSATDEHGVDNIAPGFVAVGVWPAIKLPPLVTPLPGLGYTIGDDPVKLVSAVDIADGDSDYLSKLVLKIATLAQSGDVLSYVAPSDNPITATWDAGAKTLTLSGVATKAQYEEALMAVTFSATEGALLVRGVTMSATDADGVENIAPGLVTVGVWPALALPPLVTPVPGLGYTLGDDPVKLVSAVDIADGDSDYLSEAILKIATLAQSGDVLGYVAPSGNPITATWDAGARTLTLSGVATKAQYEEALKAVTFSATQGVGIVRTITIDVTDDTGVQSLTSGLVLAGARWSLPPLVTPVGAPTYTLGSTPVKLVSAVDIADGDSDFLSEAVLRIALLAQSGDALGYVAPSGNPITATWDAGARTLTLSGVATKAQYEEALKAVTFSATQGVGIVRTITIDVTDDTGVQSLTSGFVLAGARNPLPPLVTPFGGRSYTIGNQPVKPVAAVDIVDADSDYLTSATVEVTLFGRSGDVLQFNGLAGVPISGSYDAGSRTLTLTGTATKAQYEAALKAITFTATGGAWTTRTLAIRVTDDAGVRSSAGLLTLSVW
ncbi:hypothetical protein [Mycolicibacterium sp. D5.8-2]|uniref:hypothetical protein n=1 Tax=Mycolicibacterium sp. D5.8-2 TaxID=3085903 RepID=UPI00298CC655|nr:hypothetical protein [Mycolicibacterium sp. D5.8-2]MDW5612055.1 hypothetical protein [Mycolicibacterium sp. D5.8-2]